MKKIYRLFLLGALTFAGTSCDEFLDINENPNQATSSTPQQVLPNALTVTAANVVDFNDYGSWLTGYVVNAGGFGGWGSEFTYQYTSQNFGGLWTNAYDNLQDYQYIETSTRGDGQLAYYNAIAKIMKAYNFQMLVDTYGDVPYTSALQGGTSLTPTYDKAEDIYKDLVIKLDSAVYLIDNSPNANAITAADVMFKGDMGRWERFANTLKLRLLVRASMRPGATIPAWVQTGLATLSASTPFLTDDAIVNPGYIGSTGKQNPMWNRYHSDASGNTTGNGRSRIPSIYTFSFYNGNKLLDAGRGRVTYRGYPSSTAINQLGNDDDSAPLAPNNSIAWYIGAGTQLDAENTVGIFKGRSMGQPLMLAAESYFLQAEAFSRGLIAGGNAKSAFNSGIESSFRYLYKDVTGSVAAGYNPVADAASYIAANEDDYLANFDLATSVEQQLEAIITQKYIALNFIHGHEAWNEFRRTEYPRISGTSATSTFVSLGSTSTRPDRLPTRILYPAIEYSLNPNNVPSGINQFTTRMFWDAN